MSRVLIWCACLVVLASCESVRTCTVLELRGVSGAESMGASAVDVRTGSVYEGVVLRVFEGEGPIAPGPVPGIVRSDVSGTHVVAVWPVRKVFEK